MFNKMRMYIYFDIVLMIVFLVFEYIYKFKCKKIEAGAEAIDISIDDYAICIKNLPKEIEYTLNKKDLKDFLS